MVFADESLTNLEDVKNIAREKAAHGVNIKLQKVGGIYPAVKIAEFCRNNGLRFMVGAMIEDTVGLTPAAHFAVSQPDAVFTDLDTDIDLPRYVNGGSFIQDGCRVVTDKPGLGIDFNMDILKGLEKTGDVVLKKLI